MTGVRLVLVALLSAGCAPATRGANVRPAQSAESRDVAAPRSPFSAGFEAQLKAKCSALAECEEFVEAVHNRHNACQDRPGIVNCSVESNELRAAQAARSPLLRIKEAQEAETAKKEREARAAASDASMAKSRAETDERTRIREAYAERARVMGPWENKIEWSCKRELSDKHCDGVPNGEQAAGDKCRVKCKPIVSAALDAIELVAKKACLEGFVSSGGKAAASCSISWPSESTTDVGRRTEIEATCSKSCAERSVDALAVSRQGRALILSYKRCMLATDSTALAAQYWRHDAGGLYKNLMDEAKAKCRAANRCDWLEKHQDIFSEMYCYFEGRP